MDVPVTHDLANDLVWPSDGVTRVPFRVFSDPAIYAEFVFYEGSGCIECSGTGFHGRLAVSELMDLSDHIRELILDKRPASEIRRAAKEEGMTFLRESALEQVLRGVTTLREINKVTFVE